jgi:hypothetical protein
MDPAS